MAISLNEVLSIMRTGTLEQPYVVGITLTIHSQVKGESKINPSLYSGYVHNIYYGYGFLVYLKDKPPSPSRVPPGFISNEYLTTGLLNADVKVLNNIAYDSKEAHRGSWGEYQTFIVKEPSSELWQIRIDPERQDGLIRNSPRIAITLFNRPDRTSWGVELKDDNGFLRGIGPDPFVTTEKALYVVSFGDIELENQIN